MIKDFELENVRGFLEENGYHVLSKDYYPYIYEWTHWYEGYVEKFHKYKMYNGYQYLDKKRASLRMPKRVCEEWSSLLYNDRVTITVDEEPQEQPTQQVQKIDNEDDENNNINNNDDVVADNGENGDGEADNNGFSNDDEGLEGEEKGRNQQPQQTTQVEHENKMQKTLDDILNDNKFEYKLSELIERTFALGTGAMVEFEDEQGNPKIDYIIAPMIFPLRIEQGEIVDCAFGSIKGDAYYVNIHTEENGIYTIQNRFFKFINGKYQDLNVDTVEETVISPVKRFQIIKPNIANNIDLFTPFGMSVFANALDQNETIDITYDSLKNEYYLGRKRVFMKTDVMTTKTVTVMDNNGNTQTAQVPIFDKDQEEFYALPGEEGDPPIMEMNQNLRVTEHIDGLQTLLNLFSDSCGLGPDRFNFKDGTVYTNSSQIISTQSKLYKNLVNHEKILRYAIVDMVKALLYIKNGREYDGDVTIDFDDSIIEDTEKTRNQALLELNNKLIDDVQYYIDVYKLTEQQAIEFRNQMRARTPQQEEQIEDEPPQGT